MLYSFKCKAGVPLEWPILDVNFSGKMIKKFPFHRDGHRDTGTQGHREIQGDTGMDTGHRVTGRHRDGHRPTGRRRRTGRHRPTERDFAKIFHWKISLSRPVSIHVSPCVPMSPCVSLCLPVSIPVSPCRPVSIRHNVVTVVQHAACTMSKFSWHAQLSIHVWYA